MLRPHNDSLSAAGAKAEVLFGLNLIRLPFVLSRYFPVSLYSMWVCVFIVFNMGLAKLHS